MTTTAALIILAASLGTAFVSGIFGMAGGLILMGVLLSFISVPMAMIVHGSIQMVANGSRAFLLKDDIDWLVFRRYAAGAVIGVALLGIVFAIGFSLQKTQVYFVLGLTPLLVWLPKEHLDLDILKREQAFGAGIIVQGLNTIAGVAGPILDLFFVRNAMTRQQIVATKSVTQCLSHMIKIGFWSVPAILATQGNVFPPAWFLLAAIPLALSGTWLGKQVLTRMQDANFKQIVKYLVTAIGIYYLMRWAVPTFDIPCSGPLRWIAVCRAS